MLPRRHTHQHDWTMTLTAAYIGGPMTNRPKFNFDTFDAVAKAVRDNTSWTVFNPHEHDQEMYPGIDNAVATITGDVPGLVKELGFSLAASMAWDLARVIECEHIVLLPEWETSTGAKSERFVAETTGTRIWLAHQASNGEWFLTTDRVQKRMTVAVTA